MSVASKAGRVVTRNSTRAAVRSGKAGWKMFLGTTVGCLVGWVGDLPGNVNPNPSIERAWESRAQAMSASFWPAFAVWLAAGAPHAPGLLTWLAEVTRAELAPMLVWQVLVTLFATVVLMRRSMAASGHGWRLNALVKASRRWLALHKWLRAPLAVGIALLPLWWLVGRRPELAAGHAIPVVTLLAFGAFIASREVKWRKKIAAMAPTLSVTLKISEDAVIRECVFMPRKGEPLFDLVHVPPTVKEHIKGLRERVATHMEDAEAHVHENDLFGVTSISFKPVSDEERARREWVRKTDGLIQAVTPTERGAVAELGPDVKDSAAQTVERHLAEAGFGVLVGFDQYAQTARVERLDHITLAVRERLANELRVPDGHEHKVELTVREVDDPETGKRRIDEIVVLRHPHEARADQTRLFAWQDFILTLADGSRGWLIDDQPRTETTPARVTLTWGPVVDRLASSFSIAHFATRFRDCAISPEESFKSFSVAIREDGQVVDYNLFHTLVVGQTGAGKGSILWSVVSGLLPAMRAGLVEIYAIDPKNAEAPSAPNLFKEIAVEPDQWAPMLERLVSDLKVRQASPGRTFKISKENPLRLIFIDEMSALTALDGDRQRSKQVEQNMLILLSQGRSDGNIVLAAVQAPQKDMVGQSRMFFALRVALRTETASETDLVLGNGSVEEGATAHLISPANPGNGYATAGVGFMRVEGESQPVRVRFPYTSDEQLAEWDAEFELIKARLATASAGSAAPSVEVRDLGEMSFELADLELDDEEDPFA